MNGGGLEQAGAAVAVDELFLQSNEGFLSLFPAWGTGTAVRWEFYCHLIENINICMIMITWLLPAL